MKQNLKWKKKILTYFESVFFFFFYRRDGFDKFAYRSVLGPEAQTSAPATETRTHTLIGGGAWVWSQRPLRRFFRWSRDFIPHHQPKESPAHKVVRWESSQQPSIHFVAEVTFLVKTREKKKSLSDAKMVEICVGFFWLHWLVNKIHYKFNNEKI